MFTQRVSSFGMLTVAVEILFAKLLTAGGSEPWLLNRTSAHHCALALGTLWPRCAQWPGGTSG
jgi:hypothetical protein